MTGQTKKMVPVARAMEEKERKYFDLQDYLLALNASFEAARAGDAGAEFAAGVDKARENHPYKRPRLARK